MFTVQTLTDRPDGLPGAADAGVNLVVGRVVPGAGADGADRIGIVVNPVDYREPAE